MNPQSQTLRLSQNAILYLSSGFSGPYYMQVMACKTTTRQQHHTIISQQNQKQKQKASQYEHQLCLTDGKLYIGGKYRQKLAQKQQDKIVKRMQIPVYSIVKLECKFISKWAPIQILSLEVVSTQFKGLIGRPLATLHDYLVEAVQCSIGNKITLADNSQDSAEYVETMKIPLEANPKKKTKLTIANNSDKQQENASEQNASQQLKQKSSPQIIDYCQHAYKQNGEFKKNLKMQMLESINKQFQENNFLCRENKQMQKQSSKQKQQAILSSSEHDFNEVNNQKCSSSEHLNQSQSNQVQTNKDGQDFEQINQQQIQAQIQTQLIAHKKRRKLKNITSMNQQQINNIDSSEQQLVLNAAIAQSKTQAHNQLMLATQMKNTLAGTNSNSTTAPIKIYRASEQQIYIHSQLSKNYETHNVYISDLYERMPHWKILCRVISLRTFISTKGKKCIQMYLIDQRGDDIKAMYYYSSYKMADCSNPGGLLVEGRVYSFAGGEIIKQNQNSNVNLNRNISNNADSIGGPTRLQIRLDYNCQIQQYPEIFIYPFCAKKNIKLQELLHYRGQVNMIGIVKKVQSISNAHHSRQTQTQTQTQLYTQTQNAYHNQSSYKQRHKVKAIISNPLEMYQIQLTKSMLEGQKEIAPGNLYVLNNFNVLEIENAIRLVGGINSFVVRVMCEDIEYNDIRAAQKMESQQLNKIKRALESSKLNYLNLSQIKYSKRTISELKKLFAETQSFGQMQQQSSNALYSELLISIAELKLKKEYNACPVCKRSTVQQQYTLYQCLKCKKIVDAIPMVIVNVTFSDATGSLELDVFGDHTGVIIGVQVGEFVSLTAEEKECMLQIAKFSQFMVRIKTQNKNFKQLAHTLQEIHKQQHTLTMSQIRRRTVDHKLKLQNNWDIEQ